MKRLFPYRSILAAVVAVSAALGMSARAAGPVVTNIRSFQQAGTKLVHIDYDLGGSGGPFWVSVVGSSDGGTTWALPLTTLTGKVGGGITVGSDQRIKWNAGVDWNGQVSDLVRFRVTASDAPPPGQMVLIPAGSFEMGNALSASGDGASSELPVHSVYVSGFWMQNTEVTNDQMAAVLQWAYDQGGKITVSTSSVRNVESNQELLDLDSSYCRITWNATSEQFELKALKGSGYPCVEVSWYGSAAYCNYRSALEGLTPCYNLVDWNCDFEARGYRLPTEAEWEKAARGGLGGKRFPWGDMINHADANFRNSGGEPYQTGTTGPHPDWDDGGYPYTSPEGSFGANGYGLYDMAGNVWEWCNDRYASSYYGTGPGTDPAGPAAGSHRVLRGGDWSHPGGRCRVAGRRFSGLDYVDPYYGSFDDGGFRLVRR